MVCIASDEGANGGMPMKVNPMNADARNGLAVNGAVSRHTPEQGEIARVLVDTLGLDIAPGDIDPDSPLFGDGLGLDSIDMLEVALIVSKRFGVELKSDNRAAFGSLRALTDHIMESRLR